MFSKDIKYVLLVLLHVLFGVAVFFMPFLSKLYAVLITVVGLYFVITSRNTNNEVLYVGAYIVGCEVFLRMTGGNFIYEFAKYGVILFVFIGVYYDGMSKNAVPYWVFLVLLVPGVVLATQVLNYDTVIRKTISFNISGPLCLGITALYTYLKPVTFKQINDVLLFMLLPIISCTMYLVLYTPSVQDVVTGTGSNFETSGGFGPNQVATILGLGAFIAVTRLLFDSKSLLVAAVNLVLLVNIGYRGLVTFSRGGMLTALIMIVVLLSITYFKTRGRSRSKLTFIIVLIGAFLVGIWTFSSSQTSGLIEKRYANQDASGRVKETQLSGREQISETEITYFLENPIFGIGVAKGAELRKEATGDVILSHNEITRMIAEHGTFGIVALMILLFTPLVLYLDNKHHIYLLCFFVFWLLTINHAAMRLAAPAFIYALTLLKVTSNEVSAVHRK